MKAITVRQPWAKAIIYGGKDIENRSRNIAGDYRGTVAIHAGLTPDHTGWVTSEAYKLTTTMGGGVGFGYGVVLGLVDLVDVHHHTSCPTHHVDAPWPLCSPWANREGYHLVLMNPRPLPVPIPATGRLGLWNMPATIALGAEE